MKRQFVYKLSNGAKVHPECRESYQKEVTRNNRYPSIEAALYPGYPLSALQLCDHCGGPIWGQSEKKKPRP